MARPAKGDRRKRFREDVKPPKPAPKKPAKSNTSK